MTGQLRIMVNLERFNFNLTQPKKKNLLPLSLKSGIHGPKPIGPVRYKIFLKNSDRTDRSSDLAVHESLIKADRLEEANGELAFTIEDPVNTILGSKKRSRLRVFDSTDRACFSQDETKVTQGLVKTSCLPDVEI